jgi:hypothetical protein
MTNSSKEQPPLSMATRLQQPPNPYHPKKENLYTLIIFLSNQTQN